MTLTSLQIIVPRAIDRALLIFFGHRVFIETRVKEWKPF
jgi:hypothetical protein